MIIVDIGQVFSSSGFIKLYSHWRFSIFIFQVNADCFFICLVCGECQSLGYSEDVTGKGSWRRADYKGARCFVNLFKKMEKGVFFFSSSFWEKKEWGRLN